MWRLWTSLGTRLFLGLTILNSIALAEEPKSNFDEFYAACKKAGGTFNGYVLPGNRQYHRFFRFPKTAGDEFLKSAPTPNFEFGLSLPDTAITDAGLKEIARFKTMDELDVSKTGIGDAGVKEIAKITKLHTLALAETKVTDNGLKELLALDNLTYLNVSNTGVKGPGLKQLAGLKKLTDLVINNEIVTDEVLADLEQCNLMQFTSFAASGTNRTRNYKAEECRLITLGGSPLTDKGLKQVLAFKNVVRLYLSNTKITDTGLLQLAKLESVTELSLNGTQITDQGLKTLAGMKSLRQLDLGATKVTSEGVAELRKALPKCLVSR